MLNTAQIPHVIVDLPTPPLELSTAMLCDISAAYKHAQQHRRPDAHGKLTMPPSLSEHRITVTRE
jgi:hypothetical protein